MDTISHRIENGDCNESRSMHCRYLSLFEMNLCRYNIHTVENIRSEDCIVDHKKHLFHLQTSHSYCEYRIYFSYGKFAILSEYVIFQIKRYYLKSISFIAINDKLD